MNSIRFPRAISCVLCVILAWSLHVAARAAELPVNLGSAASFGVLAGTTVTNVPVPGTVINGDLGVSPGTAVTGFPPGVVTGTIHAGDLVAAAAQADLTIAYNDAAGRSTSPITVAGNIGGQTLAPGLYRSTSSLAISSGDLTLDGGGDPNAVWIFQMASTLTVTSGRQVILINGANAANVFWQVGSSATLGTTTVFKGTILANVSITLATGATLDGRALARSGAVTLDGNIVTAAAEADMAVTKTDTPDPVFLVGLLTYDIFVTNNGPQTATNATAVDTLPGTVNFVSASVDQGTFSVVGGVVTFDIGTMTSGSLVHAQIVVIPTVVGTITNNVAVSAAEHDPVPDNNQTSVTTQVILAQEGTDLAVTKTADLTTVTAGQDLTYTIGVTNLGPDEGTSVTVVDTLPSSVVLTSFTVTSPATVVETSGSITFGLGTLPPDTGATITLVVHVDITTTEPLLNSVTVAGTEPDPNPDNNFASVVVDVLPAPLPQVDVAITKVAIPDPGFVGSALVYTLQVTNSGPAEATFVLMTDTLSLDVVFVSATTTSGTISVIGNEVNCLIPSIPPGGLVTITITVTPLLAESITNVASAFATDEQEINPADNVTTVVTQILSLPPGCIDLTGSFPSGVTVSCGNPGPRMRCRVSFPFSVTNLCPDTVRNHCFKVVYYLSADQVLDPGDLIIGSTSFYTIKGGTTVTKNFRRLLPRGVDPTGMFIIAVIDPNSMVPDIDRTNNTIVFGPLP